ncbi:MAG: ribonuclease P protein component [Actinomycetota bacterium]|nr:ribonuclease P protein component [Actinomycetota bacterium]
MTCSPAVVAGANQRPEPPETSGAGPGPTTPRLASPPTRRRATPIWRVRDRATFAQLRAHGRRFRSGPLTLTWLPGPETEPPRVAYAIGRAVGSAVVRNRTRRRLRALVAEQAGELTPGAYLIGVFPAAASATSATLRASLHAAAARVREAHR